MQDFAVSSNCGEQLRSLENLTSLEIFRCQGFGTEGVLALSGMPALDRLTLRDLPEVSDEAMTAIATIRSSCAAGRMWMRSAISGFSLSSRKVPYPLGSGASKR